MAEIIEKWEQVQALAERVDRADLDIAQKRAAVEAMREIAAATNDAALTAYVDTIAQQVEREYIERLLAEIAQLAERATNETLPQRDRNLAQHGIKKRAKEIEACDPDLLAEMGINLEWLAVYDDENNAQRHVANTRLDEATLDEWPKQRDEDGTETPADIQQPEQDPPPGVERTGERLDADYQQLALDRLQSAVRRGVITRTQGYALQAWGVDATKLMAGKDVPDASRKKYGVDVQRALIAYNALRTQSAPRFKALGLKPLRRLKKREFIQAVQDAQAAMEADRLNPAPEPDNPKQGWILGHTGRISPHIP